MVEHERIDGANSRAAALVRMELGQLIGQPLATVIDADELARIANLEHHRVEGWTVPESLRLRFRRGADGESLFADVTLLTQDGRLVLCAREATESRAAEQLMAQLGNLSVQAGAILDMEGLFAAASPIFEGLGWVVALSEVRGEIARVTRHGGVTRDNPLAEYAHQLLGRDRPLS